MPFIHVGFIAYFPIAMSLWFLIALRHSGDLFGWRQGLFGAWFLVAAGLQLFPSSSNVWLGGVLAQVALSIVLLIKDRLNQIL
jgi:hypothetical protein